MRKPCLQQIIAANLLRRQVSRSALRRSRMPARSLASTTITLISAARRLTTSTGAKPTCGHSSRQPLPNSGWWQTPAQAGSSAGRRHVGTACDTATVLRWKRPFIWIPLRWAAESLIPCSVNSNDSVGSTGSTIWSRKSPPIIDGAWPFTTDMDTNWSAFKRKWGTWKANGKMSRFFRSCCKDVAQHPHYRAELPRVPSASCSMLVISGTTSDEGNA